MSNDLIVRAHLRYRSLVERAAARILSDREEARDVASETFLALIERGPVDDSAVAPWLVASAKNRARNRLRNRNRAARRPIDSDEPLANPDYGRHIGNKQAAAMVLLAADRIPKRYRLAIELRAIRGLPFSTVASALGCSSNQARVVFHRAQARLRLEVVRFLAEKYPVPEACRRRLCDASAPGEHACARCSSLADEIRALATRGIIPLISDGTPVRRMLRSFPSIARASTAASADRIAEVATMLLFVGAAVLHSPAVTVSSSPASSASAPIRSSLAQHVSGLSNTATGNLEEGSGQIDVRDPARDSQNEVAHGLIGLPAALGVPLLRADTLAASGPGDLDIVELAAWTQGDRRGHPIALHVRITLADFPYSLYTFEWNLPRDRCSVYLMTEAPPQHEARQAPLNVSCPSRTRPLPLMQESDTTRTTIHPVAMRFGPRTVELVVVFSRLDAAARRVLHPGSLINRLRASTASRDPFQQATDRAPDEGGLSYQVPK